MTVKVEFSINTVELKVKYLCNQIKWVCTLSKVIKVYLELLHIIP